MTPVKKIKLITIDLDNTLWDVGPVIENAEKILLEWIKQAIPRAIPLMNLENRLELRKLIIKQNPDHKFKLTLLRIELLYRLFCQAGLDSEEARVEARKAFDIFYEARNQVQFYPDAIETLEQLHREYALIALSNGNASIHKTGIHPFFLAHYSAESIGRPKPEPEMFLAAMKKVACSPAETIHIGDHQEEDIDAANRLGIRTIWANIGKRDVAVHNTPAREIHSLHQVISTIKEIESCTDA